MVVKLATQPNEKRCHTMKETHRLELKPCCPVSGNPLAGSVIEIEYRVGELVLEVEALRAYVDSYQGGRGDVRSMEGMCQQITQDCANAVQTSVWTRATLNIAPEQQMIVECSANVSSVRWAAGAGRGAEKRCPRSGANSDNHVIPEK
jgi:NADPH-dependent 7-cyano-7-deazaguanine reductase QueF